MSKKLTHGEFLERLYNNNEAYRNGEFSVESIYTKDEEKILLKDKYGLYLVTPSSLIYQKMKPSVRSSVDKNEWFKLKSLEIHGDRYNYDKVDYEVNNKPVVIGCDIHGDFLQKPVTHHDGSGCPKCGCEKTIKDLSSTTEEFIERSSIIHNNFYDYSKFEYKGSKIKGIVICPIHNEFETTPVHHLRGVGCKFCAAEKASIRKAKGIDSFIKEATIVHDGKYTYDDFNYVNSNTKGYIDCPIHGRFEQTAGSHLSGCGCRKCQYDKVSELIKERGTTASYSQWANIGGKSKEFESYKVYIAILSLNGESFIKVGKTFRPIKRRFKEVPYDYYVHNLITKDDAIEVCKIEHEIKTKLKDYRYQPIIPFGGQYECFHMDALHSGAIDELIKNYKNVAAG